MSPAMYFAAAAIAALFGGGLFAVLIKGMPERRNLTVDAAQKAVAAIAQTMDELSEHLVSAHVKIDELQVKLDEALKRAHELEHALRTERRKVEELERRLREIADRQADLAEGASS